MTNFKIGFLSMTDKHGFDLDLARNKFEASKDTLQNMDFDLTTVEGLVITLDDAKEAVNLFKRDQIDLLLIQSGTFSSGRVFMEIVENFDGPFGLWGIPEPSIEEELSLNSLCGVNLHSSILSNLGKQYKYFYGDPGSKSIKEDMQSWFAVNQLMKRLEETTIGWVGSHTPGFSTFGIDEMNLRRNIGPEIVNIDLSTIFDSPELSQQERHSFDSDLSQLACNYEELPAEKQEKYAKTYHSFKNVIKNQGLDAVAVRCWPEFIEDYGQAVCATLSKLVNEGIIAGCEGDILGTVNSIIQQKLGDSAPFMADLVDIDTEENTGVMWHCGVAPFCLANSDSCPKIGEEFGIGGLNVEFSLKPGEVTITRLSYNKGDYRLLVTTGTARDTLQTPDGTASVVEFDSPVGELMDTIIYGGYEHHLGMVYGNIKEEVIELARLWEIDVVEL